MLKGLLLALEASDDLSGLMSSHCNVSLPPLSNISDFWPDSQGFVALPQGCQTTFTSRPQVILIGFDLIRSLLDHDKGNLTGQSSVRPSCPGNYLPWVLDSCNHLWRSFRQSCNHGERGRLHDEIVSVFMHVLIDAALPSWTSEENSPYSAKAAVTLSTTLADLVLSCSASPLSASNQIQLASFLTRLRGSLEKLENHSGTPSRHHRNLINTIKDNMAPIVLDVCQDGSKFTSLQKDLQVCDGTTYESLSNSHSLLCVYGHHLEIGLLKSQSYVTHSVPKPRTVSQTKDFRRNLSPSPKLSRISTSWIKNARPKGGEPRSMQMKATPKHTDGLL